MIDVNKSGLILAKEFEKCLARFQVSLSKEELHKIYSLFLVGNQVNYRSLSLEFGFHKQSYDRMYKKTNVLLSPLGSSPKAVHRLRELLKIAEKRDGKILSSP